MIVSHKKQFILLKTFKTGSTTTSVYFEEYCVPPNNLYFSYDRQGLPLITDYGIVSTRSSYLAKKYGWHIHMKGDRAQYSLRDYWQPYFKFTNIRNPFDVVVSWWWFDWVANQKKVNFEELSFLQIKNLFRQSICEEHFRYAGNWQYYTVKNKPIVDFAIRQENFSKDMQEVCSILNVPFDINRMTSFKDTIRKNKTHFSQYYTNEIADIVYKDHKFEIDYFGYSL